MSLDTSTNGRFCEAASQQRLGMINVATAVAATMLNDGDRLFGQAPTVAHLRQLYRDIAAATRDYDRPNMLDKAEGPVGQ